MKKQGYLFECDRCGETKFCAEDYCYTGFTSYPAGWSMRDEKQLCPTCTELYSQMMNNFYAPVVKRPLELDDSKREVVNGRTVL